MNHHLLKEKLKVLVSGAKAPHEQMHEGICISIPVPPTPVQRNDFNFDYEHGVDSDGEVGPFYDAVEGGRTSAWIQMITATGMLKYQATPAINHQVLLHVKTPQMNRS
jgi:hypothetical protein